MGVLRIWRGSYLRGGQTYFVVTGAEQMGGPNGLLSLLRETWLLHRVNLTRPPGTLRCGKIARFFSFVISQTLFFVRR